jgi:hypothetical protein
MDGSGSCPVAGFVNSGVGREANGTCLRSCPMAGFDNSGVGREVNGTGLGSCPVACFINSGVRREVERNWFEIMSSGGFC